MAKMSKNQEKNNASSPNFGENRFKYVEDLMVNITLLCI